MRTTMRDASSMLSSEAATILTMVVLVTMAYAGAHAFRAPWIDRYGDVAAGALIVLLGGAMTAFGV